MNVIKPDPLSLVTHHLHLGLSSTDTIFSTATGFIYERHNKPYLITNWHVVTGKDPLTNKNLDDYGGLPDIICTFFRDKIQKGTTLKELIPLYSDEYMDKPLWLEHPEHRQKVDVVAIPLSSEIVEKYQLYPINTIAFDDDIPPEVSDDVFVIGYPFSEPQYLQLPIWKKGSIASEPTVNIDQLPKMLIDTATRSGLSGSPAIFQRTGLHKMGPDGMLKDDSIIGRIRGFLGVYSGRIGKDEFKAQLGMIWKKKILDEIIG